MLCILSLYIKGFYMTELEFALQEIKDNSNLSEHDLETVSTAIRNHRLRMLDKFPNYDLFITGTGQSYGLKIQDNIIDTFVDLTKHTGGSEYDADADSGEKIEIKSLKAVAGKSTDYIGARILNIEQCSVRHPTGSFQQIKPNECDWFIFHILYGNAERLFLIPANMFSRTPKKENKESGKILLSGQHRLHKTEGQVNICQILRYEEYFEVCNNYSHRRINSNSFQKLRDEVTTRLDKIKWVLPD